MVELTSEYAAYLDELRESGETNMWGATPYLMAEFPELSKPEAREVLRLWMESKK